MDIQILIQKHLENLKLTKKPEELEKNLISNEKSKKI